MHHCKYRGQVNMIMNPFIQIPLDHLTDELIININNVFSIKRNEKSVIISGNFNKNIYINFSSKEDAITTYQNIINLLSMQKED